MHALHTAKNHKAPTCWNTTTMILFSFIFYKQIYVKLDDSLTPKRRDICLHTQL